MGTGLIPTRVMTIGLGFHDLVLETSEAGSEAALALLDPAKPWAKRVPQMDKQHEGPCNRNVERSMGAE